MTHDDLNRVVPRGDLAPTSAPIGTVVALGAKATSSGGAAADSSSVYIGSVVRGRFELESMIGAGGMGVVYRAVDRLHREMQDRDPYVAIKILNANLKRHPSALISLQRETRKAQLLAHENIVNVHSFDRDGSIVYMTMELLDGQSLRAVVAENPSGLPAHEAVPMIRGMAKALAYAHENEVVHSDFKPANVFLTQKKQIKVLDFGLARAAPDAVPTARGSLLDAPALDGMTPAYASPQMLDGAEATPADDVFALAIVAFELLAGRHPFECERPDAARLAAVKATALRGLTRLQRKAILRGLAVDPAARHRDAGEFLREFDGPSKARRITQLGSAALIALPIAVFLVSGQDEGPTVSFEELAPEVRERFERAAAEGETALSFGVAGINEALLYFSAAYDLHPENPRAVGGLETVADRLIESLPGADLATREEVFGVLQCNAYLRRYEPVRTGCLESLGPTQCESIAARCAIESRE